MLETLRTILLGPFYIIGVMLPLVIAKFVHITWYYLRGGNDAEQ